MLLDLASVWFTGPLPRYVARPNRNLTYLANVRQWIGSSTATDDAFLMRLITEASRTILNYMQRPDIGLTSITEVISGRGERKIQLRNWPILEVESVSINGANIAASSGPTSYGYYLEPSYGSLSGGPQNLGIIGGAGSGLVFSPGYVGFAPVDRGPPFPRGGNNISVAYSYGYCVQDEPQTIPFQNPRTILPDALYGSWSFDLGVTYADGEPLTPIAGGTPGQGEYVGPNLVGENPTLYYTFSAADQGEEVLLSYNYVPADVEQACIELVGERYRYKSRIGQISQTLGGQETSSYMVKDLLTAAIKGRLEPYRIDWLG